jgi:broad specificity phosphatase PhoE
MDEVVLARHGESEQSALGLVGGDTPLTAAGRQQARELRSQLAAFPAAVCITSGALRAQETAAIALDGRDVPVEVDNELGDIGFGDFEGRPLAEYRDWVSSHAPIEAPPGGESRRDTLRRFATALGRLLERDEANVLVVAHGLTIRAVLDERPEPVVAGAPYGSAVRLRRNELDAALQRLARWCERPAW